MFIFRLENVPAQQAKSDVLAADLPEAVKVYITEGIDKIIADNSADQSVYVTASGYYGDGYDGLTNAALEVRKPKVS